MELEIISSLVSSAAASGMASKIYEALKDRIKDKVDSPLPDKIESAEDVAAVTAAIEQTTATLTEEDAHSVAVGTLTESRGAASAIRDERMRQARWSFNAAITLAVIGVLIIFVGVAMLVFREAVTPGAITAGIGAVTEIVAALLFKLNNETNTRLDAVREDLSAIEAAQIAVDLSRHIEDPEKRDDAIRQATQQVRNNRPPKRDA